MIISRNILKVDMLPLIDALQDNNNADRKITHEAVYKSLYDSIITGRFEPGKTLTIRGLAETLDVSPMPVRESIRRLVALGALEMQSTRRIAVASMTEDRYREIITARIFLEPEISACAIPASTDALITKLKTIDNEIETALDKGDADSYSLKNWEFHFTLYRAANCPILLRLIESIWLQFGPFMRIIVGRLGTSYMVDQHGNAITALKERDEQALRDAIRQDIYDGMDCIGKKLLGHPAPK